jgi:hypothetical protein
MACIRRANLDAFWSRARSTANGQSSLIRKGIEQSDEGDLDPPHHEPGPLPGVDHCGDGVAIQMLMKSSEVGNRHASHQHDGTQSVR